MKTDSIITEKLTSNRTEALLLALMLLFLILSIWRGIVAGWGFWSAVFAFLFFFFLFYVLNYRTLHIRLTAETLTLKFGLFTWTIPLDNIENCRLDTVSLWRIGGAGIHFSSFDRRYRAIFNFLEYPRVVIGLKKKIGPVRDISFSTRQPDRIMVLIQNAASMPGLSPDSRNQTAADAFDIV